MKKFILVCLLVLMSFSLISCTKDKSENYVKEELSFGIKGYEVKGELIKPKNSNKPKIAVIVGGSGPTNRDASINGFQPYKDIAIGLAEKGIASFRYDKRAFSHKDKMNMEIALETTSKEEYLDDYNEVINYLSKRSDIDSNNIYTIGHSQGGYFIPKFEKTNNKPKAYVFLAAPSSGIDDALIEQTTKILQTPNLPDDQKKQYEEIKKQAEKVKSLNELSSNELVAGISTKYWMELKNYNVVEEVKKINKPMLFLQGEDDFNVPFEREILRYKKALKEREDVQFKTYKGVNHMFTKGKSTTVESEVINDIALFINK